MKKMFLIMFFMAFVSVSAYSQSDDEVYIMVEKRAEFPGGQSEMLKYIQDNRQYPDEAKENDVHGKVLVSFIVERDGTLSDINLII